MREKITCPTCGWTYRQPFAARATWTDDCACSDYSMCAAHQANPGDGPDRPSDEVMAVRDAEALVDAHRRWDEKAEEIRTHRARELTTEEREALRYTWTWVPRSTVRTVGRAYTWTWTLAHNLAIGGALCRAFALGEYFERDMQWPPGTWRRDCAWAPGCGKAAP